MSPQGDFTVWNGLDDSIGFLGVHWVRGAEYPVWNRVKLVTADCLTN